MDPIVLVGEIAVGKLIPPLAVDQISPAQESPYWLISNGDLNTLSQSIVCNDIDNIKEAIKQFAAATGTEFDQIVINRVVPNQYTVCDAILTLALCHPTFPA